jgi:hypothetical protein
MITNINACFDIKDLYANICLKETVHITKTFLNKNTTKDITRQYTNLLHTILNQNYFTYERRYYGHNKGVTMGSPMSSTLVGIFLQYYGNVLIKRWIENNNQILYKIH